MTKVTQDSNVVGRDKRRARISEVLLKAVLSKIIQIGALELRFPDGRSQIFGAGEPDVIAQITDWRSVRRIAFNSDMAIGECYMDGTLKIIKGDIYEFLALCISNLSKWSDHWLRRIDQRIRWFGRRFVTYNPVGRAQKNVAHHYDLSDELYELFLDAERQYSCALFETPQDTLEQAQANKLRHISAKLLLEYGQKVLDIGSGWGGLAVSIAKSSDVDVTGLTLSVEQQRYAQARVMREKISDRVRFNLLDYRKENGKYDRIVSVGMFEHLGIGHYREFFAKIAGLLDDNGVALIHTIACTGPPSMPHPWIRKYIFPGGYIPSLSEIAPEIERNGLIIADLEVLRLHYAETLKIWRERFMAKRDKAVEIYDERFCLMWEFYLASCEAMFRHNNLVVYQMQLTKELTTLPITRAYISEYENRVLAQSGK